MNDESEPMDRAAKNRRTLLLLSALVVGMFGFGFAMVPLYNLICQVAGIQSVELRMTERGGAARIKEPVERAEASARVVTVKFDGAVHPDLPWSFVPAERRLEVSPGTTYEAKFVVKNRSSRETTGQAIPSVVPWQATAYFNKLECFCFNQQTLVGGQVAEMPLRFSISSDLPENINSMTLSYSLMRTEAKPGRDGPLEQTTAYYAER